MSVSTSIPMRQLGGRQSGIRADAWLFSQLGNYSNSDIQYAVWSIFDKPDVVRQSCL